MRAQIRIEVFGHIARKFTDVIVIGIVRNVEPRLGARFIGQGHHHLDRNTVGIGEITHVRSVCPFSQVRIIGVHPVHEPERMGIFDVRDEQGIEHLAGVIRVDMFFLHQGKIAQIVACSVRIGRTNGNGDQPFGRWRIIEPDFTVLRDHIGPAKHLHLALAFKSQAIAAGCICCLFGDFGQHKGFDAGNAVGHGCQISVFIQQPKRLHILIAHGAPLAVFVARPRPRGFHDVQKRLLGRPI